MSKLPLIAFAPNPWIDYQWMNRQQLLSRFARRGWRVAYSTGALDIWERGSKVWQQAASLGSATSIDGVLVDRPGKILPRWRKWRTWDRLALSTHVHRLQGALGARGNATIALVFHPSFWPYVEALRPRYVAYHVYDVYSRQGDWSPDLARMEMELIQRADIVTGSSEAMIDALPGPGAEKGRVLANGADVAVFMRTANTPCPADLAAIPSPRIAYVGSINRKVDLEMIATTAGCRPNWHWVLIGHVDEHMIQSDPQAIASLVRCRALPNVHFLGQRSREEIPAYLHHMDVNTMCYRIQRGLWASAGYPLKLHEYLAVGKPVISSPIAMMYQFSDVIDIAGSHAEWLAAIDRALKDGGVASPAERQAVAKRNSWDRRVDMLEGWFREMIASQPAAPQ